MKNWKQTLLWLMFISPAVIRFGTAFGIKALTVHTFGFCSGWKPRIAFSASIGREQLDAEETPETKRLLEKYSAISVREQSAVVLLASMDIKSTLVLDPTLMLEANEWRKLASKPKIKKQYLLIYQLNPNPQMDQYAEQLAQKRNGMLSALALDARIAEKVECVLCCRL